MLASYPATLTEVNAIEESAGGTGPRGGTPAPPAPQPGAKAIGEAGGQSEPGGGAPARHGPRPGGGPHRAVVRAQLRAWPPYANFVFLGPLLAHRGGPGVGRHAPADDQGVHAVG